MKPQPRFRRWARLGLLPLALFTLQTAHAGSATWSLNPPTGDWNTAGNWTPATVPNDPTDVATFNVSNTTNISLSAGVTLASITFNPGASAFNITVPHQLPLEIQGAGIVNNSGTTQNFTILGETDDLQHGSITFRNNATAGAGSIFNLVTDAQAFFFHNASAGQSTFVAHSGTNPIDGGFILFYDKSTAGQGTFEIDGASGSENVGGEVVFNDTSSAGSGTFTIMGSASDFQSDVTGGAAEFFDSSSAADATFVVNGGSASSYEGGAILFLGTCTAGNATIIVNGGVDGGPGGNITFTSGATGGTARIMLFGNGSLTYLYVTPVLIGSIEGDGVVMLGNLAVGSNNLSTLFSGTIVDSRDVLGSLSKIGSGTLTLSGANTYTGGTTIKEGTLVVTNKTRSATGTGAVKVNSGTLGGSGIVRGTVTVSSGAFLAPAHGTKSQATLTIQSALTFNSGATYTYAFKAKGRKAKTDKVLANGVTINSGASFNLSGTTQGSLTQGTVLTVISNTAATPISGTFSNLADGAVVSVNGNNLQANYEGGDGNDLTLTVVP